MIVHFKYIGLEFVAEANITPIIQDKTSGKPEDCYPEEGGECEIISLTYNGADAMWLLDSDIAELLVNNCFSQAMAEGDGEYL